MQIKLKSHVLEYLEKMLFMSNWNNPVLIKEAALV